MANRYKIAAEFTLVDNASKMLKNIGVSGEALGGALSKSYRAAEERVSAFGRAAVNAGKMAAGIATGAVVAGLGVAAKEYIEFNNALTQSTALFKDTQNLSGEEMLSAIDSIGQKAREVAAVTEFTATDMAGALQKMAMAGIDSFLFFLTFFYTFLYFYVIMLLKGACYGNDIGNEKRCKSPPRHA